MGTYGDKRNGISHTFFTSLVEIVAMGCDPIVDEEVARCGLQLPKETDGRGPLHAHVLLNTSKNWT